VETENAAPVVTEAVAELIALGAAMAANNEEAFQRYNFRLHKMGISREDRIQAVNIALQVKMAPHRNLVDLAEGYLMGDTEPEGCSGDGQCHCEDDGAEACCGDEACSCAH
jgi:hypothetical protein